MIKVRKFVRATTARKEIKKTSRPKRTALEYHTARGIFLEDRTKKDENVNENEAEEEEELEVKHAARYANRRSRFPSVAKTNAAKF